MDAAVQGLLIRVPSLVTRAAQERPLSGRPLWPFFRFFRRIPLFFSRSYTGSGIR